MKTKIYSILAGALLVGVATSCDEKWEPAVETTGTLNLASLSLDTKDADKVVNSNLTRAAADVSDFKVSVIKNETPVNQYTYGEMPGVLTLAAGNYSLNVESHDVQLAEWDKPYYVGTKDFTVNVGKITDLGVVTCKFASLKVTVDFDEDLRKHLGNDVTVTVKASSDGTLVFTPSETRAGYYQVTDNLMTFCATFEGSIDGNKVTTSTTFKNVQAGEYRKITYSAKYGPTPPEQTGTTTPTISLDTKVEIVDISKDVTIEEDIIDSTDRPGQEEPLPGEDGDGEDDGGDDAPDVKVITFEAYNSPSLKLDERNTATSTFGNAIVRINSTAGIKNLLVTISSPVDNAGFMDALEEMDLKDPFDLTAPRPGNCKNYIVNLLHLPIEDAVINKNSVDFDITAFIGPLMAFGNSTFDFEITVTDVNNVIESMTLKFKTN